MAIININLFSNNALTSSEGKVVAFDGQISATPTNSNTVTKRPVEDGFDSNDAIHNNAKTVAIQIVITDTAQSVLDTRALTNLANITGAKLIQSYTKKQLNILQAISDNKETVEIKTKYDTYIDYFLENFTYSEDENDALIISFTISENRTDVVASSTNIDDSIGVFS